MGLRGRRVVEARGHRTGEPSIGWMPFWPRILVVFSLPSRARSAPPCPRPQRPVLVMREDGSVVRHRHSLAPAETFPAVRSAADQRRSAPTATLLADAPHACPASSSGCSRRARSTTPPTRSAAPPTTTPSARSSSSAARRKLELGAVVKTLEGVAARGQLTASRLAPLFLTLQRNREWWTKGPLLAPGRRVGFDGSQIVWQYYPGAGIQIQVLGTFGKVNALWSARSDDRARPGRRRAAAARRRARRRPRLGVLLRLPRGQGAVGLQPRAGHGAAGALARGARGCAARTRCSPYTSRGLGDLRARRRRRACASRPAPASHYAQYSFEPGLRILNGFIQSLVGLYDYGALRRRRPRQGAVRRRARRAPARRCRPTTPARGRCTRAGPSRTSPTSATTRCCATSSTRSATARRPRSTAAPRSTSRPT